MKKIIAILLLCITMTALTACGGGNGNNKDSSAKIPANPGDVYRVIALDEAGAPVPGVAIQFCSDTMCLMGETGEDGIAVFEDQAEGTYTVHIYQVPEGYAEDDTEYEVPQTYGDVKVVIKSAK